MRGMPSSLVLFGVATVQIAGCSLTTDLDGLSVGAQSQSDASTATAESRDGGANGKYVFIDDFARANTTGGLGNGWQEKSLSFRITDAQAMRLKPANGASDYRDNVASRPTAELAKDVELQVEFRFHVERGGYVQLHARLQRPSLSTPGSLEGYFFYWEVQLGTFVIARHVGSSAVILDTFRPSRSLDTSSTFRMRLRVTGSSPVALEGTVERKSAAGAWESIGSTSTSDSAGSRFTTGDIGFGSGDDPSDSFSYDQFEAREL